VLLATGEQRIVNFEMAVKMEEKDEADLPVEAGSSIFASPKVLRFLQTEPVSPQTGQDDSPRLFYNPFKEDVYSFGLTLLQACTLATNA